MTIATEVRMITTTQELEELIDGTVGIPTIPTLLNEITRICEDPEGTARDASDQIERDPAIATRVLRLVNSPFYGLRNPVSSISLACSVLGLKVLKNVVVQATVLQTFEGVPQLQGFDLTSLWDHSFKTAVACKLLTHKLPAATLGPDDAYTCGLIHDIGKMILIDSQAESFAEALGLSRTKQVPLAIAEGEVFGFNHAHVGGLLAQRWNLPETVQAAVTWHHSPAPAPEDWARGFLVRAASTMAHQASNVPQSYVPDLLDDDSLQSLELSDEESLEILAQVGEAAMV
jgi:putative nucleotidyltransferase with HDIG domain